MFQVATQSCLPLAYEGDRMNKLMTRTTERIPVIPRLVQAQEADDLSRPPV